MALNHAPQAALAFRAVAANAHNDLKLLAVPRALLAAPNSLQPAGIVCMSCSLRHADSAMS